jgi:hypothetical protein
MCDNLTKRQLDNDRWTRPKDKSTKRQLDQKSWFFDTLEKGVCDNLTKQQLDHDRLTKTNSTKTNSIKSAGFGRPVGG